MTGTLRCVLGDQLDRDIAALRGLDPRRDIVLMVEVMAEATYVPHHPKKIAFILSAMRHFAHDLRCQGIRVRYVELDDPANTQSFRSEMARAAAELRPDAVSVTEPGEWRVLDDMRGWAEHTGLPVEILPDDRFFCSTARFARWAEGNRQLRMELFYRDLRRRTGLLMQPDGEPEGGHWNFDADNRKPLPDRLALPEPFRVEPDAVTQSVLALVMDRFGHHFGEPLPFWFAVTRADALRALHRFVAKALPRFGDYQDAMKHGEGWLFHSALSQYLNVGLLRPAEVCAAAERAWRRGNAPLNSAEGFIRQILGWREYVRGIYWLKMPGYARLNGLDSRRPLPWFYWTAETDLNCLRQAFEQTRREALSHHIQRLMVTGNFALLAGVAPDEICAWYLAVYADAYEWVELPNVLGMVLYADGGYLGSKPYAASGNYINCMSDFCGQCRYDVRQKAGETACPFNYLYWNFLIEKRKQLGRNPRLAQPYRNLDRLGPERVAAIRRDSARFLDSLAGAPADAA
ncbi:MAG: cryptochrome/photolyase family protein [Geminicoccaceae bacterium]